MSFGLALGIGSLLASGAAAAPAIMNYGPERRKALLREGPDDFGDYNYRPGDKFVIEEESLPDSQKIFDRKQILKSGEVRSAQRLAKRKGKELPVLPEMKDSQDFLDTYSTDILELQKGVIREGKQEDADQDFYSKGEQDRRRVRDQERLDLLTLQSNNLEYQRSRDRRADMQYNENLARLDRKDRRTAISSATAGLAALAAAFAI